MSSITLSRSEQFGNLLAVRDSASEGGIGCLSVYVSSIIQFQPLADLEFLHEDGTPLAFTLLSDDNSPISRKKVYACNDLRLHEEIIVHQDYIICYLQLSLNRPDTVDKQAKLILRLTGALLFAPQGAPYDWREETLLSAAWLENNRLIFKWGDTLRLTLESSIPFRKTMLKPLQEDLIEKVCWFTSPHVRRRYSYWVPRKIRQLLAQSMPCSSQAIAAKHLFYAAEVPVSCSQKQPFILELRFKIDKLCAKNLSLTPSAKPTVAELRKAREHAWAEFVKNIPTLETTHSDLKRAYYMSWFTLFSNAVEVCHQKLPFRFTAANKLHYYNQFFWDSAFHAISLLWHNNPTYAEDELKNFIVNQWKQGMFPHELFLFPVSGRDWMDTDFTTSAVTQPPAIAVAIREVFKKTGNLELLKMWYEPLLCYESWLWKYRDIDKRGLSFCCHMWETGIDNSPVMDHALRGRLLDPCLEFVHFNVFLYLLRQELIHFAHILGLEPPPQLLNRVQLMRESMNCFMLDKNEGFYYDLHAGEKEQVRIKTFGGLLPLITDIPDNNTCTKLLSALTSEAQFGTICPVPSVSRSEPTYKSYDFWRGATWPHITWTFVYGLKQRWPTVASWILSRFLTATAHHTFCNEYYDSETGAGVGLPFQGWGTLYIDLILRHVAGIEPEVDGFSFAPLNTGYVDFKVSNCIIHGMSVCITRASNEWVIQFDGITIKTVKPISFRVAKKEDHLELTFNSKQEFEETQITGDRKKLKVQWLTS